MSPQSDGIGFVIHLPIRCLREDTAPAESAFEVGATTTSLLSSPRGLTAEVLSELGRSEHFRNGGRQAAPARALERQLSPAGRRDAVVLRALIVVGELPLRVDPALPLETMQRRIEGTVIDVEHLIGAGAERNADTVAVLGSPLQGPQNQQVERALEQIRLLSRLGHR